MNKPPVKRSVLHSLMDALRGIWCCVKSERNMRIHFTATSFVVFAAVSLRVSRAEAALLTLAIGAVFSSEMLNTAIEKFCDFSQKNYSITIKKVKDIAAGAVLLAAMGAVAVGVFVFWTEKFWKWAFSLITDPFTCAMLLITLIAAWFFIFWGPIKIYEKLENAFDKK